MSMLCLPVAMPPFSYRSLKTGSIVQTDSVYRLEGTYE